MVRKSEVYEAYACNLHQTFRLATPRPLTTHRSMSRIIIYDTLEVAAHLTLKNKIAKMTDIRSPMSACTFIKSSITIKFSQNSQRKNFEINESELNIRRRSFPEATEHAGAAMNFESLAPTTLPGASRNIQCWLIITFDEF
uniref:Uncharacterized protein n=1 Tax=Glossina austeni TaxID=7395 RepID=A0A1A9VUF3_GLOAU